MTEELSGEYTEAEKDSDVQILRQIYKRMAGFDLLADDLSLSADTNLREMIEVRLEEYPYGGCTNILDVTRWAVLDVIEDLKGEEFIDDLTANSNID
jgi:hypothetical protein